MVYLIESGPFFKIGIARSVIERVRGLQVGNPIELHILEVIGLRDDYQLEAQLAQRYRDYHVRGEWYRMEALKVTPLFPLPEPSIESLDLMAREAGYRNLNEAVRNIE